MGPRRTLPAMRRFGSSVPLLLGLDLGTSRFKASMVDGDGCERVGASVASPFIVTPAGTEMTVEALLGALRGLFEGLGRARSQVEAIGIAGMAESGAPFDGAGRPLAPVIAWHDPRGSEVVARMEARFGDELSGWIGQRPRAVSSAAKMGWLVDHGAVGLASWLGVPELCLHALTGVRATDYSLAARTGCFDIGRRLWLPEVAATAGFPVEVFPPIGAAGEPMGAISAAGAAWSGIPAGVPATLAGHDHLAAFAGSGATGDDLGNSVGTAESVVGSSDRLPDVQRSLALRAAVTLMPRGDGWAVLAGAARAGRALDTVAQALGNTPSELDSVAERGGSVDMSSFLAALQAGDDPELPPGAAGDIWNGLLQALTERTVEAVARAVELVGPARRLVVFGGGSRSRPWLRAKARACSLPVWRSSAGEAAARGAALQAGVAAEWWPSLERSPAAAVERCSDGGSSSVSRAGCETTGTP